MSRVPKSRTIRGFSLLALLQCTALCTAQIAEAERKGVADALYVGNLSLRDLIGDRVPYKMRFAIPAADAAISSPLEAADALMHWHGRASQPMSSLVSLARVTMLGDPESLSLPTSEGPIELPSDLPPEIVPAVRLLAQSVRAANTAVRRSLVGLSTDDRRVLIEGLPQIASPGVQLGFARSAPKPRGELITLLGKVDLAAVRFAAERLLRELETALPELRRGAALTSFRGVVRFLLDGMPVVIAGKGSDLHEDRGAVLSIDLGGDDRYSGRHGAGPGYASLQIDLGGSDRYEIPDLSLGAGLLGIGVAFDLGGDDTIRAGSLALGVGIGGVGAFLKEAGDDDYSAGSLAQGFGFFGIGLCVDTSGRDRYFALDFAQGSARTQGVGWLVDRLGNDTFQSEGRRPHIPSLGKALRSNAQGYASGFSGAGPMAGGVGLLTDFEGDDLYVAGTCAQASSDVGALGSLFDAGGADTYRAVHAAQAAASSSAAYLFDLSGDDLFAVTRGFCHAAGGSGGVAFLLDRAGADQYCAHDSRPGMGHGGGLGIFIESGGQDSYVGPPGTGVAYRTTGSLGVFVDLGGADRYAEGLADGSAVRTDVWGLALDRGVGGRHEQVPEVQRPSYPQPGSEQRPDDSELERIYIAATGEAATSEAREAVRRLVAIGMPALEWMTETRLVSASEVEVALFARVAGAIGESGRRLVAQKIANPNDWVAESALLICAEGIFAEAHSSVAASFARPALLRPAARAAGALRIREAVPALMLATANAQSTTAVEAMRALAAIGDPQSVGTAEALVTSDDALMRRAAFAHIAAFPERAAASGSLLIGETDERRARIGIELLGASGSEESLRAIANMLDDGRPGVRIEAMLALHGRCPKEFQRRLVEMRRDPVEIVRSVAQTIDPGR